MNPTQDFDPIVLATITAGTQNANPLPECPPGWALHRVWTVLNEQKFREHGPVHNVSAFLEDHVHDYKIVKGKFHYYSRLVEPNKQVVVAFEFAPEKSLRKGPSQKKRGI